MAKLEEVRVPDIGGFDEVDVVEVLVQPGDRVAEEDSLITLESDKASMEVPSPKAGTVKEIKISVGDKATEGQLIAVLEIAEETADRPAPEASAERPATSEDAGDAATPRDEAPPGRPAPTPTEAAAADRPAASPPAAVDEAAFRKAYAGPAVRRYARELGVDLGKVAGSGRKGRILREDVQGWVKRRLDSPAGTGAPALPAMPEVDFSKFGPVEEIPLGRIQKKSAANLHRSWLHVPHVTQHEDADVTDLESFRRQLAPQAEARGVRLTPVAFVLKVAAAALRRYPRVNSSLSGDGNLVLKRHYHLGVAVDTEDGLVVPVIRDVDQKGVFDLAEELGEVSQRARDGKLRLDDLQGATFTITSLGGIGGTAFTPIVNAPEVAILGLSRHRRQPVYRGDELVPRLILPLSLSYDHRVVDGALACRFVVHLAELLGDVRRLLL